MGYLHIDNLYRQPEFLECYALEKIHGTSAHITYNNGNLGFFSGGESLTNFMQLFNIDELAAKFKEKFLVEDKVYIYGEAFGGKQQGMSATYGPKLRFIVFDVKINEQWVNVPAAEGIAKEFGLEFVPYERGLLCLSWLDEQRDRPSRVAVVEGKQSEGIVIRPIYEQNFKDGGRVIFKHKTAEFRETKTKREVSPDRVAVMVEANAIAEEYVTAMRLEHVLQKNPLTGPKDYGNIIRAMQEDVRREASGEIEWSREVGTAIGKATVALLTAMPKDRQGGDGS